jgi:uncharacterized protein (TIGR03437 family)
MRLWCGLLFLAAGLAAQAQVPVIAAVQNFGNGKPLSPAAYAFVYGSNLGPAPAVFIGTTPCQVFSITPTFVSIQIPANISTGSTSLTVQSGAGTSAPFPLTITPTSPVVVLNDAKPPFSYFFEITSAFIPVPTPSPGNHLYVYVDGVGTNQTANPVTIAIDGLNVPVLLQSTFQALIGPVGKGPLNAYEISIPALPSGTHTMTASAGGVTSPAVAFSIINRGLFTSQTGLTFFSVQGAQSLPTQSFAVLSGSGTINFSLTTSTVSGGSWLSATPSTGTSQIGTPGTVIQVQVNPSGLAIGTYYGTISLSSPDAPNSGQTVTVVLNILANVAPFLTRTGAVFVASPGGANPATQSIAAFNGKATAVSFTSAIQGTGASLFKVSPTTGSIPPGQAISLVIQATSTGVSTGAYTAQLTISFSDGTTQTVALLLVVAPAGSVSTFLGREAGAACVPTKLLPVFTLVGNNFTVPAAWPTSVEVTIVDDCGNPMNTGEVVLSFSNGDSPLRLDSSLSGVWSVTWPPANPRNSVVLTLTASEPEAKISGSAQISGVVNANPAVPQVSAGGVVETAAYGAPVAPGDLVAIFGASLSSTAMSATMVPLPIQLLNTQILIDGQYIPLFYTSSGQVNAVIPYGLQTNTQHQLVAQTGGSLSVPQSVLIGVARPGVFTIDASGSGQGHIYKIDAKGNQIRADQNSPAKAGDTLVIYCSGLGAVNPPLTAGTATPLTFLTSTVDKLTATIGGQPAVVNFAGLTPGSTGLYQVNAVVPPGLPSNNATALQLTISGQISAVVTLAVQN